MFEPLYSQTNFLEFPPNYYEDAQITDGTDTMPEISKGYYDLLKIK